MFLLGGTAFSGKTLLAHLLNQGDVVCLDEPDFHDFRQRHRGAPVLASLFPDKEIPPPPDRSLSFREAVTYLEQVQDRIQPVALGMKTAGRMFIEYAGIYQEAGYPVIAVIRDVRDVLAEAPLPEWIPTEEKMASEFSNIWRNLRLFDALFRYEDLVTEPAKVLSAISALIGRPLDPSLQWSASSVHHTMLKLERHEMLQHGSISQSQVGIWRKMGRTFNDYITDTAELMGYAR
jgi:hypothetical protein